MTTMCTHIKHRGRGKLSWYLWSIPTPIGKVVAYEHSVPFSICVKISKIRSPIVIAVVRIFLNPVGRAESNMIDVIAERLLFAPKKVWTFATEPWFSPIIVKRQCLGHPHSEYDVVSPTLGF